MIDCRRIARGNISPAKAELPFAARYDERNDIRSPPAYRLQLILSALSVEESDAALVPTNRVGSQHPIPACRSTVDAVGDFRLQQHPEVNRHVGHSAERTEKAPCTPISDIVSSASHGSVRYSGHGDLMLAAVAGT